MVNQGDKNMGEFPVQVAIEIVDTVYEVEESTPYFRQQASKKEPVTDITDVEDRIPVSTQEDDATKIKNHWSWFTSPVVAIDEEEAEHRRQEEKASERRETAKKLVPWIMWLYIVGFFMWIPCVITNIMSWRLLRCGYWPREKRNELTAILVLESLFLALFGAGIVLMGMANYNFVLYIVGLLVVVVTGIAFLICGGIRMSEISKQNKQEPKIPIVYNYHDEDYDRRMTNAALITYVLGLLLWLPQLVSIAISLHQVRVGFIRRYNPLQIILSIFELLVWLVIPAAGWLYAPDGCQYYDINSSEAPEFGVTCGKPYWWGWFTIIIWILLSLAFGLPRICNAYKEMRAKYGH